MKIIPMLITMIALPLMALGQAPDQQQGGAQGQTENQEKAPAKKKKAQQTREMASPSGRQETGATMHQQRTSAAGRTKAATKTETGTRSNKTTQTTTVNKEQFKSSHREVFNLGQHPKQFFVQRYGANHVRLIGNTYFVFVDNCWVAVNVAGFTFVERVICQGDPDYVVVY